ncbi:hypothetical protein Patl1_00568 [Pistacia atlantica]|uniref:Uncharacterized protein n=1 Tax=Pistacia atlantica TaxID=434234 RepID=A0ACC1CDP5_9ROSI|nr:hypothetical protein Patl1_00568 [Pistacia atlantica]
MKDDICKAIEDFMENDYYPTKENETSIALIPKIECPEFMSQYRSISCSNFIYKVIAKVLTNRLKLLMNTLISHNQSAFVNGRLI